MELLRNADLYDPDPKGTMHLLVGGETILWAGADLPESPELPVSPEPPEPLAAGSAIDRH